MGISGHGAFQQPVEEQSAMPSSLISRRSAGRSPSTCATVCPETWGAEILDDLPGRDSS